MGFQEQMAELSRRIVSLEQQVIFLKGEIALRDKRLMSNEGVELLKAVEQMNQERREQE
jgi:cytidylate kinase